MKKIISILLAIILVGMTTVTAFALEGDYNQNLDNDKAKLLSKIKDYKMRFTNKGYYGLCVLPRWSENSLNNLFKTADMIEQQLQNCTSYDDIHQLDLMLEQAADDMCVNPDEMNWLLNYMYKDYTSVGYYDETTTVELKKVYEDANSAYISGDEKSIHVMYVALRNELNKLCLCNDVVGDVNFDGIFSIDDITMMQKKIADIVSFNSSQNYISYFLESTSIDNVTSWQKELADMKNDSTYFVSVQNKFLNETEPFILGDNYNLFNVDQENYLYHFDHSSYITEKYGNSQYLYN